MYDPSWANHKDYTCTLARHCLRYCLRHQRPLPENPASGKKFKTKKNRVQKKQKTAGDRRAPFHHITHMMITPTKLETEPRMPMAPRRQTVQASHKTGTPRNLAKTEYICDGKDLTLEVCNKEKTSFMTTLIFCTDNKRLFQMDNHQRIYEVELSRSTRSVECVFKEGYSLKTFDDF